MSVRILAIDTTTEACSVALLLDDIIDTKFELCVRKHTERILPLINGILTYHQLTLTQLDALAFNRGPGNFTGVRISVSIAQGLAFGACLPLLSVSALMTLAEIAWQYYGSTRVLLAIDAHGGKIYWGEYQRSQDGEWHGEESEAFLQPDAALLRMQQLSGEWIAIGTGWQIYPKLMTENSLSLNKSHIVLLPTAVAMLPLAKQLWLQDKILFPEQAKPIYLCDSVL